MQLADGRTAYHVVVSSGLHENLDRLQNCDELYGMSPTVLGFRDPRIQFSGYKHGYKLLLVKEFLQTINPESFVFFTDAHDVLTTASIQTVFDLFVSSFPGAHLVFSTEKSPYPSQDIVKIYPESALACVRPFLNSGAYCGYAGEILSYLTKYPDFDWTTDDQAYWQHVYVAEHHTGSFQLDHGAVLFVCMMDFIFDWKQLNWSDEHQRWSLTHTPRSKFTQNLMQTSGRLHDFFGKAPPPSNVGETLKTAVATRGIDLDLTYVKKELAVTYPVVLHFNGTVKALLPPYYRILVRNHLESHKLLTRHHLNAFETQDKLKLTLVAATALWIVMICFYCLFRMIRKIVIRMRRKPVLERLHRHVSILT